MVMILIVFWGKSGYGIGRMLLVSLVIVPNKANKEAIISKQAVLYFRNSFVFSIFLKQ